MRKRGRQLLLVLIPAAVVAGLLASPPARRFYRANEARYLLNEHRYVEALETYARLRDEAGTSTTLAAAPRDAGFPHEALRRAAEFYTLPEHAGREEEQAFAELVHVAGRFPELTSATLRLRLRANLRHGVPAPDALAAAREILAGGYDAEALWWLTLGEYRPQQPLRVPEGLGRFRKALDDAAIARDAPAPDSLEGRRLTYLRALLALDDENWARAAALFAEVRRAPLPNTNHELPYGLALMRSGQPAAAIPVFREFTREHPNQGLSEELAIECSLRVRDFPRAAALARRLGRAHPESEAAFLGRAFPELQTEEGAATPTSDTLTRLAASPRVQHDVGLWDLCRMLAHTPAQQVAVAEAARRIAEGLRTTDPPEPASTSSLAPAASSAPLAPHDAASLLQFALTEGDQPLALALAGHAFATAASPAQPPAAADASATTTLPLSAETLNPGSDQALREAALALARWFPTADLAPAENAPAASPAPLAIQQVGWLMNGPVTQSVPLTIPPRTRLLVVMAQGYAADGAWPLLNIAVDGAGEQLYDVRSDQNRPIPLLFVLDPPVPGAPVSDAPREARLTCSLIDGTGDDAGGLTLLLADVYLF